MAKATATCTCERCGATFTKTVDKPNRSQADSWIAWAELNIRVCPACYKAEKAAEAAAEIAKANAEIGLAQLEGTPKQIAWATDIRDKFIAASARKLDEVNRADEKARLTRYRRIVLQQSKDSHWWIENRYSLEPGLIPVVRKKPADA